MQFDIDDIKPSALKRLLKQALLKEKGDSVKEKGEESDDKEKEDLADLHEEQKGSSKSPKVENDDLPEDLKHAAEDEQDEEDDEESPKGKRPPPFKKGKKPPQKGKKPFPFQKKKD